MKLQTGILVSIFLREFIFLQIIQTTHQATIGDGTKSLYTGNLINTNDTRGSCIADGVQYMSETAIPRDHPCHYCICYQSQVTCYWKQCSAPPVNCDVMMFENVCNPSLYVCQIPQQTVPEPIVELGSRINNRRLRKKLIKKRRLSRAAREERNSRRKKREALGMMDIDEGFPVQFEHAWKTLLRRSLKGRRRRAILGFDGTSNHILNRETSCVVFGVKYNLGEVIGVASDVCMECRCAAGTMFCSPKCCFLPSPFSVGSSGGNSLFIKVHSSEEEVRPRHPLHHVRNQFEESPFLK